MSLYKRGKLLYMDAVVNGVRYRESLGTSEGERFRLESSIQRLEREAQAGDGWPDVIGGEA